MRLYGPACLVALASWTHVRAQRRLNDDDDATRCMDQAGFADGEYIVGKRAWEKYAADNDTDSVVEGWNMNESDAEIVTIKKDCPIKYKLHYGDQVALIFTKMEHHGSMGFDFTQEYQDDSERLPSLRFYFAWEKFVDYYRPLCGEVGVICWDRQYVPWRNQATGSYTWWADQYVEDLYEVRRDFYHQKNRTAGRVFHYNWRRRRSGYMWMWPAYGNSLDQHYGEEGGKLRVVLSAVEPDQMTDMGQDTVFQGELEFHEWGGTGDIKKEQYDSVKELYRATCAPRRNGTAWNQPWEEPFNSWAWRYENDHNWDSVPYCTWLKDGWNASYWDQHIDHQGGTCHMIEGVRCDEDGNVIYLWLSYRGMSGNVMAINNLPKITTFHVSFNTLSGTIPPSFSTNTLQTFGIRHNFFNGDVPCLIGREGWSSLDLSYNNFGGTLPDCYGNNAKWTYFRLEHNFIQGSYPESWKTLVDVRYMFLQYNELSGTLPDSICKLHNAYSINIEANRFEGQLPQKCLESEIIDGKWSKYCWSDWWCWYYYAILDADGWVELSYLTASHNRFTGPVPVINGDKDKWAVWYATYEFDHNFFNGTIGKQWEGLLNISRSVTFLFRDNRLSGPLPPQMEEWSKSYWNRVRYDFADNFFRCEPDGRWPDWVQRSVDDLSYWWSQQVAQPLGKCLPVAHPLSVSPASVTEGQAATLYISGSDFVQRAFQKCRFTHQGTSASVDVAAIRNEDELIRCQVPISLARGTYDVTVSNFGDDFASKELLDSLQSLPTFQVVPVPVATGSNAVEATMTLGGVSQDAFEAQQASFVSAIEEYLEQEPGSVRILSTHEAAAGRRLQSGASVSPRFIVFVNETNQKKGEEYVRGIVNKLKAGDDVKTALETKNIKVTYLTVLQVGTLVADPPTVVASSDSDSGGVPIIWIIIAAASGAIACCLCGFILFLYHMERKGQAYFKESLDDAPDNEPSAATEPQKIGASTEETEGADV